MANQTVYELVSGSEKRDSAEESFLPQIEDQETCRCSSARTSQRRWTRWRWIGCHVGVAMVYMVVIGTLLVEYLPYRHDHPNPHFYEPAQRAISYKSQILETVYDGNPFAGDPRPEHEEAWYNLLKNANIRVTADDLHNMNQSSLGLKSGGYVAQLGVFHHLHCVKWVRQWMHREHYWPELHGVVLEERKRHIDHCLEMFRQKAMCHPDLSLGTYSWFGSHPTPTTRHQAQCVNWDALRLWHDQRTVGLTNLDELADRPPTEDWEPKDLATILGEKKGEEGEMERFSQALVKAEPALGEALDLSHLHV